MIIILSQKSQLKNLKNNVIFYQDTQKITFTVPIEREVTRIDKNVTYTLEFIDSAIFMASLLSNLVNNLSEEIHKIKCKYGHDDKKYEACGIKYKYCDWFREYKNF